MPSTCDVINSQYPIAGAEVLYGSPVNVYLKSALVPVPNLVSRTVPDARMPLTDAGLVFGNDPAGDGRVESQEPAAKTLVCPGSAVTVTVSVPPVVSPDSPVVSPDAEVVPAAGLIPRWWPIPATLTFLALLIAGLLLARAIRTQQGQKGILPDIRVVPGVDPGTDVEVTQSPSDRSSPTCVVRIEPHADSGTQVLEEGRQ